MQPIISLRPSAPTPRRGWAGLLVLAGIAALYGLAAPPAPAAEPVPAFDTLALPEADADIHLGVVSCAGSTCHGAAEPLRDSNVLQNEFITWHREDAHAGAFKVLREKAGQRIARNLGLEDAASAPECLACHADYVPEGRRGKRHQLSDGVGCEACHGGGSRYLGPHVAGAVGGVSMAGLHARNVSLGMYPTGDPQARARLCLSCHLGTRDKFASHRIMGAGHPRLSFELDTFTALQPAHYRIDSDYRQRKAVYSGVQVWAVGQVMAARDFLELYLSGAWPGDGIWPELAFFDCHACHHPMKAPRWNQRASVQLPPGVPRLNDSNMLMLLHLAQHLDPQLGERLHAGLLELHKATLAGGQQTREAAAALAATLEQVQGRLLDRRFGAAEVQAMIDRVAEGGAAGEYNDYAGAEQAVMALASLVQTLSAAGELDSERAARMKARILELYQVLKDEDAYRPERLAGIMAAIAADRAPGS